jgi:Ca-activated chloride channel family protein
MKTLWIPATKALVSIGFFVLECLGILASGPFATAQSPWSDNAVPRADTAPAKSLRVDAELVLVPVMVTDAMNRPVTGLDKQDFSLYQDDVRQEIRYFSTEDAPISVGLLLDLSKSMSNKFDTERAAVSEFFKNANPQDNYLVIIFSDHPKILSESTQSIDAIEANLASRTPDGNTALLDAISMGATRMRSAPYRRRALLIISDGGDNHSRHHLKEIKRLVQDSDVDVYALGIFDTAPATFEEFMGRRWLSAITGATGGRTVAVKSLSKVPGAAAAVSREMRDQYVLGYRPTNVLPDRKRRKIRVQVSSSGGSKALHTYYKQGYAPADEPVRTVDQK